MFVDLLWHSVLLLGAFLVAIGGCDFANLYFDKVRGKHAPYHGSDTILSHGLALAATVVGGAMMLLSFANFEFSVFVRIVVGWMILAALAAPVIGRMIYEGQRGHVV